MSICRSRTFCIVTTPTLSDPGPRSAPAPCLLSVREVSVVDTAVVAVRRPSEPLLTVRPSKPLFTVSPADCTGGMPLPSQRSWATLPVPLLLLTGVLSAAEAVVAVDAVTTGHEGVAGRRLGNVSAESSVLQCDVTDADA